SELIKNPSCMDDYDPNAMSVQQAKLFISQFLSPVEATETITIRESLGRVLSKDIISPCNVPNHHNSAMDGFAYKFEDANKPLKIIGTAFAGRPYASNIQSSECIKIMTGAVIPAGADTVVMQERTTTIDNMLTITEIPQKGANIRLAGEDLSLGQTVLAKGHLMRPADLGLIASLGQGEVEVYRKLKVAFFSTGDELVGVGQPLEEGQIYDSNRYTLYGMLNRLGVEVHDLGAIPDQIDLLESTLLDAASNHDVVITSGGVSVGEADHMKTLLSKHGQVLFWKINMKPGRPLAYGKVNNAHYFGLPGNPVATMVAFYQFVRDALVVLMGSTMMSMPLFSIECSAPIKKAKGRTEFVRGLLYIDGGIWKVKPTGNQSSGVLSSMSAANCFIVLDEATGSCEVGTQVQVQMFEGII
ncbi:MAG: molybdopterin molybdotransferase MoeA, partial [Methylophilus sp.]